VRELTCGQTHGRPAAARQTTVDSSGGVRGGSRQGCSHSRRTGPTCVSGSCIHMYNIALTRTSFLFNWLYLNLIYLTFEVSLHSIQFITIPEMHHNNVS